MSLHYICPEHGDIGLVYLGCGADSYIGLANTTSIVVDGKAHHYCTKCLVEFWDKTLPVLELSKED